MVWLWHDKKKYINVTNYCRQIAPDTISKSRGEIGLKVLPNLISLITLSITFHNNWQFPNIIIQLLEHLSVQYRAVTCIDGKARIMIIWIIQLATRITYSSPCLEFQNVLLLTFRTCRKLSIILNGYQMEKAS